MTERIQCSAIWIDNGNKYPNQPVNIITGFVVCGLRHHNCFATLSLIWNTDLERVAILRNAVQGFLTSYNRFVDRREGRIIAYDAHQIGEDIIGSELTSEDLW